MNMWSFLFAVLGSFIFWAVFLVVGAFVGTFFLKRMAPKTWKFVTTGDRYESDLWIWDIIWVMFSCYLLWPFIAFGYIVYQIFKFIVPNLVWKPICAGIKFIDKNAPTISVTTKKN